MADLKISALTASTTPLAGTEVLPIVQSSTTKQVSVANLTAGRAVAVKNITASDFTSGRVPVVSTSGLLIDNANLLWDNTNAYLGIGISPSYRLHIERSSAGAIAAFKASDTSAAARTIVAGNSAGDLVASVTTAGAGVIYSDSGLTMALGSNGLSTARLRIETGGDVTVNTGNLVIGTSGKGIDFSATPGTGTSELFADYEEGTWTPSIANSFNNYVHTIQVGRYTKVGNLVTVEFTLAWTTTNAGGFSFVIEGLPFTPVTLTNYASGGGIGKIDRLTTAKQVMCQVESATASVKFYELNTGAVATALASASWNTGGSANLVSGTITYQV